MLRRRTQLVWMILALLSLEIRGEARITDAPSSKTIDSIESLLAVAPTIPTLEGLLALFDEDIRSQFSLVAKPKGLQKGSPHFPRVLMRDANAKLVVAFNGNPQDRGHDSLEVLSFNEETASFEMFQISYSSGLNGPQIEKNPRICLACHGENPKPLLDDYPQWPGFYGQNDDTVTSSEDVASLTFFHEAIEPTHPRYSLLKYPNNEDAVRPYSSVAFNTDYTRRPNLQLQRGLSHWMGKRMAGLLRNTEDFERRRWVMAYATDSIVGNCGGRDRLPSEVTELLNWDRQALANLRISGNRGLIALSLSQGIPAYEWQFARFPRNRVISDMTPTHDGYFGHLMIYSLFWELVAPLAPTQEFSRDGLSGEARQQICDFIIEQLKNHY